MSIDLYNRNYKNISEHYGSINAINHILRTPITCILGFSHGLSTTHLTTAQKQYTQNIETSTYHLLTAIDFLIKEVSKHKSKSRRCNQ